MLPLKSRNYKLDENAQPSLNKDVDSNVEYFLVCGLGNLGQHCVQILEKFGVHIIAIDCKENKDIVWEVQGISDSFKENVIVGDCRKLDILEKAKIRQCRAVLLVTSDEQVNIEAAFAIRKLNLNVRLVIRSAQRNINEKLKPKLENFVAYDANKLPVEAIATRALGDENRGFIQLGEDWLGVVKDKIDSRHKWCSLQLHKLNTEKRRVLSHKQAEGTLPTQFYQWKHDAIVHRGDEIAYIEVNKGLAGLFAEGQLANKQRRKWKKFPLKIELNWNWKKLSQEIRAFLEWSWESAPQQLSKRLILIVFTIWATLLLLGIVFLNWQKGQISNWNFASFYSTFVMLLGGYEDVFPISSEKNIDIWMRVMNLLYMSAGLLFIGMVNAWLTQWWLNEKFELSLANPIPKKDHVVIVGLGRQIGRPVAMFLHNQLQQSVVGVSRPLENSIIVTQVEIVVGDSNNAHSEVSDLPNALAKVNLDTAKGIVIITDDEKLNLEIGLMAASTMNANCALIVRTLNTSFSDYIKTLFTVDKVKFLCVYDIAAAVFAATAFGKEILNLLWLNEQMVLVTEYIIKSHDIFNGRLLTEVAYRYKIVPIFYQDNQAFTRLMPWHNINLKVGDRLVFLATIESLIEIEQSQKQV
jgi:Trk K+ transport system NAD-binding subunit